MVTVFVREHIRLCERAARRPKLRLQFIEKPEVNIDALVHRTIERADIRRRWTATRLELVREERRLHRHVVLPACRECIGPVLLDAVHVRDDAAILTVLGIRARLAILRKRAAGRRAAVNTLVLQARKCAARPTRQIPTEEQEQNGDYQSDPAAANRNAPCAAHATHASPATLVVNLACVEPGIFVDVDHRRLLAFRAAEFPDVLNNVPGGPQLSLHSRPTGVTAL